MASGHLRLAPDAGIPSSFYPVLGRVMVQHAFMDTQLQQTIIFLAKMDSNAGISILMKMTQTSARAEVLQNLATTKIRGIKRRSKVLVLAQIVIDLSKERNIVAHQLPYSYNVAKKELAYFSDPTRTTPRIKEQPPYLATNETLHELAERMQTAAYWLWMLRLRHPYWTADAQFPWRDKFRSKVQSENRKARNSQRKRQAQRKSSPQSPLPQLELSRRVRSP